MCGTPLDVMIPDCACVFSTHTVRPSYRCSHSDFANLIEMVPPKFYLPPDADEVAKRFQKYTGKQQQSSKYEKKLASVERKRARLDPSKQLSATELQELRDQEQQMADALEKGHAPTAGVKRMLKAVEETAPAADDGDDDDDREADGDGGCDDDDVDEVPRPRHHPVADKPPLLAHTHVGAPLGSDGRPTSVEILKQRLAEKLSQFRSIRGGVPKAQRPDAPPKVKQPKHVAGGQNKHRPPAANDGQTSGGAQPGSAGSGSGKAGSSEANRSLEYNKLAEQQAADAAKNKRKMSTAALLAQAEEDQRRKRARLSAPDGGGEEAGIEEWQRAMQKAGGIKQKDNPTLLRKALKREERKKKKSKIEWSARVKTVAKAMKEKQETRKKNLNERVTKNKMRASRMKARAGFEGKKSSFL